MDESLRVKLVVYQVEIAKSFVIEEDYNGKMDTTYQWARKEMESDI